MGGRNGELAEIAAIAAQLSVDGGQDWAGWGAGLGEEDRAFFNHGGELLGVCAGAVNKSLDREGGVDEFNERWDVPRRGRAEGELGRRFLRHG